MLLELRFYRIDFFLSLIKIYTDMVIAWLISGAVLLYYLAKALETPGKPNWNKAIVSALFWPFSIVTNWMAEKKEQKWPESSPLSEAKQAYSFWSESTRASIQSPDHAPLKTPWLPASAVGYNYGFPVRRVNQSLFQSFPVFISQVYFFWVTVTFWTGFRLTDNRTSNTSHHCGFAPDRPLKLFRTTINRSLPLKKPFRSLFILILIIAAIISVSPPSVRGILIAVGTFEVLGISVMTWMAATAKWVYTDPIYQNHLCENWSSTRRFLVLVASESFEATGASAPFPPALIWLESTPIFLR